MSAQIFPACVLNNNGWSICQAQHVLPASIFRAAQCDGPEVFVRLAPAKKLCYEGNLGINYIKLYAAGDGPPPLPG